MLSFLEIREEFVQIRITFYGRIPGDPLCFQHGGYRLLIGLIHFDGKGDPTLPQRLTNKNIKGCGKIHAEFRKQGICLRF